MWLGPEVAICHSEVPAECAEVVGRGGLASTAGGHDGVRPGAVCTWGGMSGERASLPASESPGRHVRVLALWAEVLTNPRRPFKLPAFQNSGLSSERASAGHHGQCDTVEVQPENKRHQSRGH